ncbi:hypothetical protein BYT27DRAFT_7259321 [Phlegmacium glaucopus]|nr:hypothetical protein BYT27DRAFT_7259321 [Phlegmacium glaucopus]
MPRCPTVHAIEPNEWFPCLIQNCQRKFQTIGSRTRHIQTRHDDHEPQIPHLQNILEAPRTPSPPAPNNLSPGAEDDFPPDDFEIPGPSTPLPTLTDLSALAFGDDTSPIVSHLSSPSSSHSSSSFQSDESVLSTFTEYHPLINGEPCNEDGTPLLDPESQ